MINRVAILMLDKTEQNQLPFSLHGYFQLNTAVR